jgi:hypothetical protein
MTLPRHAATRRLALSAGAAVALCVAASGVLPGFLGALGYLLPALLLLLALLGRTYPGERILLRLVGHARVRRRRPAAEVSTTGQRPRPTVPRGSRLIAFALAVRPPPSSLLARS